MASDPGWMQYLLCPHTRCLFPAVESGAPGLLHSGGKALGRSVGCGLEGVPDVERRPLTVRIRKSKPSHPIPQMMLSDLCCGLILGCWKGTRDGLHRGFSCVRGVCYAEKESEHQGEMESCGKVTSKSNGVIKLPRRVIRQLQRIS